MLKKVLIRLLLAGIALFVLIQLVPYGHDHTNPPVSQEVKWDNPLTQNLAIRACYDCHSNKTVWPWYSNIAPISWLVQRDVKKGRQKLNFSEWDVSQRSGEEAAQQVQRGKMPQWYYVMMHPSANLSPSEKDELVQGLIATLRAK